MNLFRDTAGQKNFRTINKNYYGSTKAFVLVYDVTNPGTFQLIEELNKFIENVCWEGVIQEWIYFVFFR